MMNESRDPDFSQPRAVGHAIPLLLLCMTKRALSGVAEKERIKRKLKVRKEQKLRDRERGECGNEKEKKGTTNHEINIFCIITYSFLGC